MPDVFPQRDFLLEKEKERETVETGTGIYAGIIGLDVGADPVEALDLVLGFLFIDLTGDDF